MIDRQLAYKLTEENLDKSYLSEGYVWMVITSWSGNHDVSAHETMRSAIEDIVGIINDLDEDYVFNVEEFFLNSRLFAMNDAEGTLITLHLSKIRTKKT